MFDVNPSLTATRHLIGHEKTPVVVVDDFLKDMSQALSNGRAARFDDKRVENTFYPGLRSDVDADYGMAVLKFVAPLFYQQFSVPKAFTLYPRNGCFSLITQQPEDLNLLSCIPHYDNNERFSFAILHYLNGQGDCTEFGGTGFYRHRPTGFENITQGRRTDYLDSAQQHINTHGNPKRTYMTESNGHYELIHKVDYRPNRLVLYPATLLHSAFIDNPSVAVDSDPNTGRLTSNFFIDFQPS